MSHSSRRGSVKRQAHHPLTTPRLKQAGRHALETLESRIAPSTLVTLSAGTLGVFGDSGGGGEDESLVFTVSGGALRISDPAHAIVAGLGTVQDGPHAVLAPLASLTDAVHVSTGGGHDSVAIEGAMPALHAFSVQSDDPSSSIVIHGSISVHGADGKGGTIAVTAGRIALEGATLDASGPSGGGAILVGGDLHGGGSLAHAQFVTVDAASVLRADALSAGHGGKVVVWSDQLTSFAGQVSARGGSAGGDGGTLEVSGRELLDFRGLGNASAPHGHAGSLLLDPKNITVDSAAALGAAATTVAFGDQTGQSVSLNPGSLTATLNTGTAVTLQASNDLTVNSAISANNPSGAGGALTLQAGRSLLLNASIMTDDGALTLVANETAANGVVNADRDPGAAVITMASGVALNSGAGTMTITMGSGAGLTNSTSGDLALRDLTAGALSVTNQGATAGTTLNLLGAINSTGASSFAADAVTINTSTGSVNAGAVTLKPFMAGRAIDLGTKTAGTLGMTDTELDRITTGLLQIGDANSGAITVSATLTQVSSLSLTTGAGMILNQAVTMAANKNFTATTVGTISFPNTTSDLATTGTGFITLTTATNISLAGGASITTVDGNLTLSANQQATPTSGTFIGINLAGTGSLVQSSGAGNVSLLGKGGNSGANDFGVQVPAGAKVQGGTTGSLLIQGTGGASSGGSAFGVSIGGAGALVTSSGGPVQVVGQGGGAGTVTVSYGVALNAGGTISAGGTGSVTVQGTGGNFGSTNVGVLLYPVNAKITSSGGNVLVIGQGGGGAGSTFNHGILLTGAQITAGGLGTVTVQGTGGVGNLSYGVTFEGSSSSFGVITSGGGAVQVTATAGTTTPVGLHVGDTNFGTFGTITTAANGGNLTLISDGMAFTTDAIISAGAGSTVTLRPKTTGVLINLGGTDGGRLALAAAELNVISAGTVQIGDAASGAITVSAAVTPNFNLSLTTGAGIAFSGPVTMGANKSLTATASATTGIITLPFSVSTLAASGTGGIALTAGHNIALSSGSSIATVDGNLSLSANQQTTAATGAFYGISVTGATVRVTGAGALTLQGRGGDNANGGQTGVEIAGTVQGGTSGLVTVQGTGGPSAGAGTFNNGVEMTAGTITSGGANVQVVGLGGGIGFSGESIGVFVTNAAQITAGGAGTVTVQGTGGGGSTGDHLGVWVGGTTAGITSSGGNVHVIGQGGLSSSGGGVGVEVSSGSRITAGGSGTVLLEGTGGALGSLNHGVVVVGTVTSSGGNVQVIGAGAGAGGAGYGVDVGGIGTITAGDLGTVTVQGTGGPTGTGNKGVRVDGTVTSASGNVSVTALAGGNGNGDSNYGLYLYAGQITAGGTGTVTVLATGGGGTGGANDGIHLEGASNAVGRITSGGGAVKVTGVAGTSGAAASYGLLSGFSYFPYGTITTAANGGPLTLLFNSVSLMPQTVISTTATGTIILAPSTAGTAISLGSKPAGALGLLNTELATFSTGTLQLGDANSGAISTAAALTPALSLSLTTGSTITLSQDITLAADKSFTANAASTLSVTAGNLAATGTGAISLTSARNISLSGTGSVKTVDGALSLSANQQAVATAGSFTGISISGYTVQSTGAGALSLAGKGGDGTGAAPSGIQLSSGGKVIGGTGPVDVRGTGGPSNFTSRGVFLTGAGVAITSTGGNVQVIGQGGGTGSSLVDTGVELSVGSTISAGGTGTVIVRGTGGNGTAGNTGVENPGTISSSGGNVSVTGQGTSTGGGSNYGVDVSGLVTAGGAGQVFVSGTGGNSSLGSQEVGVSVISGGRITSSGGNVLVTGQGGGTGASSADYGVYLQPGSTVSAGGLGSLTIFGTGGGTGSGDDGVVLQGSSGSTVTVTTSGGSIQVTGTARPGSTGINQGAFSSISTLPAGGDLTLIADSMSLGAASSIATAVSRSLTVRPLTAGTAIDLGGNDAPGTLGLNGADLAAFSKSTSNFLRIGDSATGAILVNTIGFSFPNVTMTSGSGIVFGPFASIGTISGGQVVLDAGSGTVNGNLPIIQVQTNFLTVKAGGGIGSAAKPFSFMASVIATDSSAGNGDEYLAANTRVGGLNAGTGTINLSGATFTLNANDQLADLSKVKLNGATLALGAFHDTVAGVSLLAGSMTGSGTLTSTSAFDLQSGTVSANLAGNVGMSKTTTGTVVLSGANSYTGTTTVAAGILNVQSALALGGATAGTTVSAGATLQMQGGLSLAEAITLSDDGAAGSTGALESLSGQNALTGLVTLAGATKISVDANAGLTFSGGIADTTSGTSGLTLAIAAGGNATFPGGVGGTVLLKSFTSTGAGLLKVGGTMTTAANSTTFGTPVKLVADTTINSASGIAWQSGATLDGDGAGPWSLTLNADTDGSGSDGLVSLLAVGATAPLKTVVFGSNVRGITLAGAQFNTTAAQAFPVAVTLGASESISATAGDVSFADTVNGGFSLAVHSSGTTSFAKVVGNTAPLTSLSTDAGGSASVSAGVTTIGAQSYGGNLTIAAASTLTTTNGAVTIGGATTLGGNLTFNAGSGNITLTGTVDGAHALVANSTGATLFGAAIGGVIPLTSVTTNAGGTTTLTGNVTTTGTQSYGDNVTIAAASTLATTNSAVSMLGTTLLNADLTISAGTRNIHFTGTVNGAHALVANSTGATTFSAAVGGTTPLAGLTTNAGGTTTITGNVTTTGAQAYGDNVTTSPTTLKLTTTNSAVSFGGTTTIGSGLTINAGSGDVTLAGTLMGGMFDSLTVNSKGATIFNGDVGSSAATLATSIRMPAAPPPSAGIITRFRSCMEMT